MSGVPSFQLPDRPMSGDELMTELHRYFAEGNGNPALEGPMVDHYRRTGNLVHAVMATFNLEKITMYRRRR